MCSRTECSFRVKVNPPKVNRWPAFDSTHKHTHVAVHAKAVTERVPCKGRRKTYLKSADIQACAFFLNFYFFINNNKKKKTEEIFVMYFISNSPQARVGNSREEEGWSHGESQSSWRNNTCRATEKAKRERELQQGYRRSQRRRDIKKMADKKKGEHRGNGFCGGNGGDGVCVCVICVWGEGVDK